MKNYALENITNGMENYNLIIFNLLRKKDSESFDDLRISLLAVKFLPVSENVEHFLLKPAFLPQNVYIGCWGVKEIHLIPTRPVPRKFPISRK